MFTLSPPESEVRGELEALCVEVVVKDDDKYADIPFITSLKGRNATVYPQAGLLAEAVTSYGTDTTADEVEQALIALSATSAVLRRRFEGARPKQVADYYRPLSSPDELMRTIFDRMELDLLGDAHGKFLLRALQEDEITKDVARINALRLATRTCLQPVTLTNLSHSANAALQHTLTETRSQYERVMQAFGDDSPINRERLFASSLQESMIAFAFPMNEHHAECMLKLLPK